MFNDNSPVLATGIGTTLTSVGLPALSGLSVVIAKPCEGVSTALAYAAITPHPHDVPLTDILSHPVATWRDTLANDFEPSISAIHPEISRLRELCYDSLIFLTISHQICYDYIVNQFLAKFLLLINQILYNYHHE